MNLTSRCSSSLTRCIKAATNLLDADAMLRGAGHTCAANVSTPRHPQWSWPLTMPHSSRTPRLSRRIRWMRTHIGCGLIVSSRSEPNSVVIFDNVALHWDARCLDRIRGTGALLVPLPAYSPEVSTCSVPLISSPSPSSRFSSSPASPFSSSSLPSPCTQPIDQLTLALSRTVESHRASLPG